MEEQTNIQSTKQHRNSVLIWIGLFLLGVLTRIPFVGQIMYHWDSINFAYAIQEFSVAKGQPHVPGYILYVYLTRLVDLMFNDPQQTMTAISIVSSGLAVAWLYLLGRDMFNDFVGVVAALFLASSPLFWFYGEIALPHSLDTFAVILSAWFLYRIMQGDVHLGIPAAIWLGIAGGFRPQTQVFLAPLILFAGWRLGWKRGLIAIVVLGLVDLLWFVPLLWLNGGPTEYFGIMGKFSDEFQTTTSVFKGAGWFGLTRNATKLTLYTLYGWALAVLPFLIGLLIMLFKKELFSLSFYKDKRSGFAFLWIAPSFLYYLLIHMGQQGLVFVYLPMLLILSAAALTRIQPLATHYKWVLAAACVIINSLIFLLLPTYPFGDTGPKLLNVDTLRQHDSRLQGRFEAIRQQFPPEQTVILAGGWRFPQFYLPDYRWIAYRTIAKRELGEGQSAVKGQTTLSSQDMGLTAKEAEPFYLILFDDNLSSFNQSTHRQQFLELPNGQQLIYLTFSADEAVFIGPQFYDIVDLE